MFKNNYEFTSDKFDYKNIDIAVMNLYHTFQ